MARHTSDEPVFGRIETRVSATVRPDTASCWVVSERAPSLARSRCSRRSDGGPGTPWGLAAVSALSGAVAARAGFQHALLWAGLGIVATTALGLVARLPDATTDVSPWNHWRMPAIVKDLRPELDEGPVLVTVEYRVNN